ncbi:hypothetical protein ANN_25868 [Periplaneta americana]|uniref:Reverse transcriptase domain-containing protein n=1 Tax=Periplaneta americana TaxID=6978 RepID=A0ABQ8S4Q2_PERAM|nr:hypothetical protein ANN_25868 [Periplaneta americana]
MAGLCEGGNEPSGSLKAICGRVAQLVEQLAMDWKVRGSIPGGDRIFSRCQAFRTAPRFTQPPIKLSTGSFPGVKGGQSVVPTTPSHSSAEVMESMGLYLHLIPNLTTMTSRCSEIGTKLLEGSMAVMAIVWKKQLEEEQFGFRKGKGTRDANGLLRTMGERYLEKNKEVYIVFVDLEKAFDRVE